MFRLGIDYGTSSTVAVLSWPDGRRRPLLFDGSPLLPSAVFAEADGRLVTGRDAVRCAQIDPTRLEPNPKRHLGEGEVLLGDRTVSVSDLVAATLRTVSREARRTAGQPVDVVCMTHPAAWGASRRALLAEAAVAAGLPHPTLVPEPVAAATYFVSVLGRTVPVDHSVIVYDLGAGTCDASVVTRRQAGFETRAYRGIETLGGLDLDAVVVDLVIQALPCDDRAEVERLSRPETPDERRAFQQLWTGAREVKEALSRQPTAALRVPLVDRVVHVTREQLEAGVVPLLSRTVELTVSTVDAARVPHGQRAGVFLVGGSTRMPLVATLLHRAMMAAPSAMEQPELVVAEGAVLCAPTGLRPGTAPVSTTVLTSGPATVPWPYPPPQAAGSRRRVLLVAGSAVAAALAGSIVGWNILRGDGGGHTPRGAGTSGAGTSGAATTPTAGSLSSAGPSAASGAVPPPTTQPASSRPLAAGPAITVNPTSGRPGSKVTVTGSGFTPGHQVEIQFHAQTVSTAPVPVAADGTFTSSITVPANLAGFSSRAWTVQAVDRTAVRWAETTFTVTS